MRQIPRRYLHVPQKLPGVRWAPRSPTTDRLRVLFTRPLLIEDYNPARRSGEISPTFLALPLPDHPRIPWPVILSRFCGLIIFLRPRWTGFTVVPVDLPRYLPAIIPAALSRNTRAAPRGPDRRDTLRDSLSFRVISRSTESRKSRARFPRVLRQQPSRGLIRSNDGDRLRSRRAHRGEKNDTVAGAAAFCPYFLLFPRSRG